MPSLISLPNSLSLSLLTPSPRCTPIKKKKKCLIIGLVKDISQVDSECLFGRYCRNLFDRDYKATIGVDFEVERFMILDQECNMQM